jgi:hypothetical protein
MPSNNSTNDDDYNKNTNENQRQQSLQTPQQKNQGHQRLKQRKQP